MRVAVALTALLCAPSAWAQGTPAPAAAASSARVADLPLDAAARARYVGRYTLGGGGQGTMPLRVFEEGGVLLGQLRTNAPSRLLHQGGDAFRPADAPGFVIAFTVVDGRATQVSVSGEGMALRGARDADAAVPAVVLPDSARLFTELARMDSVLFDASFVRCDAAAAHALLADDVEFYHDLTGLHRGAEVRADFDRLTQNCPRAQGVRRELVPGTLRVYPVSGFGAVQMGEHRFVGRDGAVTAARFVHVWRREGTTWKASRVLSLDHRAAGAR